MQPRSATTLSCLWFFFYFLIHCRKNNEIGSSRLLSWDRFRKFILSSFAQDCSRVILKSEFLKQMPAVNQCVILCECSYLRIIYLTEMKGRFFFVCAPIFRVIRNYWLVPKKSSTNLGKHKSVKELIIRKYPQKLNR